MCLVRVSDGEHALEFLRRQGVFRKLATPALVVLDVDLPQQSGFEVHAMIRQTEELKSLPVAMFTSLIQPEAQERARIGGDEFFLKNADWDKFIESVRSL